MEEVLISLKNVKKSYKDKKIIKNIDLDNKTIEINLVDGLLD